MCVCVRGRGQDAARGGDQLIVDVVLVGGRCKQTPLMRMPMMALMMLRVMMLLLVVGKVMLVRCRRQGRRAVGWQVSAGNRDRQSGRRYDG